VGERRFAKAPPQTLSAPAKPLKPVQPSDKLPPYKFSAGLLDYLIPGRMAMSRAKAGDRFKSIYEASTQEMVTWRPRIAAADSYYEAVVASVASEQARLAAEWSPSRTLA
jgi:hypothetical protein